MSVFSGTAYAHGSDFHKTSFAPFRAYGKHGSRSSTRFSGFDSSAGEHGGERSGYGSEYSSERGFGGDTTDGDSESNGYGSS